MGIEQRVRSFLYHLLAALLPAPVRTHCDDSDKARLLQMTQMRSRQRGTTGGAGTPAAGTAREGAGMGYWFDARRAYTPPQQLVDLASERLINLSLDEAEKMWQSGIDTFHMSQLQSFQNTGLQAGGLARLVAGKRTRKAS